MRVFFLIITVSICACWRLLSTNLTRKNEYMKIEKLSSETVTANGVNTVLENGFVWAFRYSETDEPDKQGRWARLCYYKGKLICWVSKIVTIDLPTYYKVSDFFPSIQLANPCYSGIELDKDFETVKKEVEQRFMVFIQAVC